MEAILNNPYRILGVPVNAKASEIQKNKNKIKAYITAGKDVITDYDFKVLGPIKRDETTLDAAIAAINLNEDKFRNSCFWFYNGNYTDEPAFEYLKIGEFEKTKELWEKIASNHNSHKNFSALINLSTLYLYLATREDTVKQELLSKAIEGKLTALSHEETPTYIQSVADQTYKATTEVLQEIFIEELCRRLQKEKDYSLLKLLNIIKVMKFDAANAILKKLVNIPLREIEGTIDNFRKQRKSGKNSLTAIGRKIAKECDADVKQLATILGKDNIKFINLSDKIAEEIMQCAIDYYNQNQDNDDIKFAEESMKCLKLADKFAIGMVAKQRYKENLQTIQENITQEKEIGAIKIDLKILINILAEFDNARQSISNAMLLIKKTGPVLSQMKKKVGVNNSFYLNMSTNIAAQAQGYIVTEVNEVQEELQSEMVFGLSGTTKNIFWKLKNVLKKAWEATLEIQTLDMDAQFKSERFFANKRILMSLCKQLDVPTYERNITTPTKPPTGTIPPKPPAPPSPPKSNFQNNAIWTFPIGFGLFGGLLWGVPGLILGAIFGIIIGLIVKG